MAIVARTVITQENESWEAGRELAVGLRADLGPALDVVIVYVLVNHDQEALLAGIRHELGPDVAVVGCSTQGITTKKSIVEGGYAAAAMGLGGDSLTAATGIANDIAVDTAAKGRELGRSLRAQLDSDPRVAVLLYDPLTGADMDQFLETLTAELGCPVIGGGAGHYFGPMTTTFQYFGGEVHSGSAVVAALAGEFGVETALSTGCSPVGVEMVVTRVDGPTLLELDGEPALAIWKEIAGSGNPDSDHTAALALGVPVEGVLDGYLVRAAFGTDEERRGVVLQSSIPTGTAVMLHHRTIAHLLEGTEAMGESLRSRLAGRTVCAVLGFECGARTEPFLGPDHALRENIGLQQQVGPDAEWLGMIAWGEVYSYGMRATFNNYTYPLLVLTE